MFYRYNIAITGLFGWKRDITLIKMKVFWLDIIESMQTKQEQLLQWSKQEQSLQWSKQEQLL